MHARHLTVALAVLGFRKDLVPDGSVVKPFRIARVSGPVPSSPVKAPS